MQQLQAIPLSRLLVSPHNVRKTGGTKVADLATSIVAHGLLHNLTVIASGDGQFEVIDGGRRLAALQLLAKKKKLPSDHPVPCLVRADADAATELSVAANAFTEPMHPADQCEAFKRMIAEDGATIADIAGRFSVSELVVRQRLKLANVSAKLIDVYRGGKMNLDQLQTLALSDDHKAQEKAWFGVKHDYERQAYSLRERLTNALISPSDRRTQLIGLAAYEAAGGAVLRDLFSTSNEGYLADGALLDRLVAEKLEAAATELRAAGWAWVEVNPQFGTDYTMQSSYGQVPVERHEPTPVQAARLAALADREAELQPLYNDLDGVRDATTEQLTELESYEGQLGELDEEREAIFQSLLTYPNGLKAMAGAVVTIDSNGIKVCAGRLRPGEKLTKGALTKPSKSAKPAKKDHSDAVMLSLSAHRSAVVRYHVMGDTRLALALMVEWLLVHSAAHRHNDAGLLRLSPVSVRDPVLTAPDLDPELLEQLAKDQVRIDAVLAQPDPLAWLMVQAEQDLLELLALGVGRRFDGLSDRGTHTGIDRLHQDIDFDMAQHWKPSSKHYLSRVSSDVILRAVSEACGKKEAAALAKLNKPELIGRAEPLLTAKRWLPKPLRLPVVKKPRDGKQKAAGDGAE